MSCFFTASEITYACYDNGVQAFGGSRGFGGWALENGLCDGEVYCRARDPRDTRGGGTEFHISILPDAVLEALLMELERSGSRLLGAWRSDIYEEHAEQVRVEIAREKQKRAASALAEQGYSFRTRLKFLCTGKL